MSVLAAIGSWLWFNTAGNIVAAVICGVAAWFWKIRPHLRRQAEHRADVAEHLEHERAHRRNVEHWFAGLHERLDAAGIPDVPLRGRDGR